MSLLLIISIALLGLVSVSAGVLAMQSFTSREATLARLRRSATGTDAVRARLEQPTSLREQVTQFVSRLSTTGEAPSQDGAYTSLRQQLIEAGFRRPSALRVYMGSRIATTLGVALLVFPASIFLSNSVLALSVLVAAGGLGFVGPGLVLTARRTSRQNEILRGLPDAIDLMVVCVEAGLSLAATLDRVAKEFYRTNTVLASELKLTVLETQAGKSLSDALRALAVRNGVQDLSTLASSLIQTERMGTRVADTLRIQSDAIRVRRLQQAEEVAQRAPVKMLLLAGLFIFPAMFVLLVPAFLGTLQSFQ